MQWHGRQVSHPGARLLHRPLRLRRPSSSRFGGSHSPRPLGCMGFPDRFLLLACRACVSARVQHMCGVIYISVMWMNVMLGMMRPKGPQK